MPDPQKQPSTASQVGEGFKALQKVVNDSTERNKKDPNQPKKKPEAPPIDTGSFGGLVSSLGSRLKYAVYGPDDK